MDWYFVWFLRCCPLCVVGWIVLAFCMWRVCEAGAAADKQMERLLAEQSLDKQKANML